MRDIHRSKNTVMVPGPSRSQTACRAWGSAQEANPLDSSVNPIPALASCRLAHSWPLTHYAPARIMSGLPGWLVPGRRVGAVCEVTLAA